MTARVSPQIALLGVSFGLLTSGACHETTNPREHYGQAPGGSVVSSGGASSARGGREPAHGGGAATPGDEGGRAPSGGSSMGPPPGGKGGAGSEAQGGSAEGGSPTVVSGGAGGEGEAGAGGVPNGDECGAPPVGNEPFTREGLRAAATACASWQFCRFEHAALTLRDAIVADAELTRNEAARQAFVPVMDLWSEIELFQFGPLGSKSESAGKDIYQGQGIRELVYAWPASARCRIEEQLVSESYATQGMSGVPISGRGLFGLEYLLFYPGTDTVCASLSTAGMRWPTLASDLPRRKASYARALATDVLSQARSLLSQYGEGGGYRELFVSGSGYPDEQEALTVLAWSLVYLEREVKDWKLGVPAGFTLEHPVSSPETPFAGRATSNIRANLRGFARLFQGCGDAGEGLGFDDWLREAGHGELADDMLAALKVATQAAAATPELDRATVAEITDLYRALKALTDLLKTDLFGAGSPLNLKLPAGVASDTD